MCKVPPRLQDPAFRFVLLGNWDAKSADGKALGKTPFEKGWQTNGYRFDDPKLLKHPHNFGVIGGYGRLRVRDIDDHELAAQIIKAGDFDTFTVRTGSGGLHLYYLSDYDTNHVLKNGELRAKNYQVVCPGCKHPSGGMYEVIADLPIKELSPAEMSALIAPHMKQDAPPSQKATAPAKMDDVDRSRVEMGEVIRRIRAGQPKEQIFTEMLAFAKWATAHPAYREMTYTKAGEWLLNNPQTVKSYGERRMAAQYQTTEPTVEEIAAVDLGVISDEELMIFSPKPTPWLVENVIPLDEIGLIVGKRQERKTFTALHIALSIANGSPVFGIEKVPEKKRVLFLSEEDSIDTIATRIKILKKGMGIGDVPLEIKYISYAGLKLDREDKKFLRFKQLLQEFKPALVIIDALQRCVTFEVDKDNAKISSLFTETLRPLQRELGCGWLIVHHMRKPANNGKGYIADPLDEIRGGTELVNYCRYVLMCQKPRNQNTDDGGRELILFKTLKQSNAMMAADKVISFTPEDDGLKIAYEGEPENILSGEQQAAAAIKKYLIEQGIRGEFKTADIREAADAIGFKKSLLSNGLSVLVGDKFLVRKKRGVYEVAGSGAEQVKLTDAGGTIA